MIQVFPKMKYILSVVRPYAHKNFERSIHNFRSNVKRKLKIIAKWDWKERECV